MLEPKKKMHFYIDVVSACNLRCPSCPVGNSGDISNSSGVMTPDTLNAIMGKATTECSVTGVGLFNWTEPLLRVSLSGFSQKTYGITHRRGDIELVKKNLQLLMSIKASVRSPTRITIAFHRYLSNLDEETELAEYCERNGLEFQPIYAQLLPLEKALAYCGRTTYSKIGIDDRVLIDNLAPPLDEALISASSLHADECNLLEQQVTLNWRGDAMLCCAAYDETKFTIGNYLKYGINELQEMRRSNAVCSVCMNHGISNYYLYKIPKMDVLVGNNIKRFRYNRIKG